MIDIYLDSFLNFFEKGGAVLIVVFFIAIALWTLLIEKFIYLNFGFKKYKKKILSEVSLNEKNQRFKENIKLYMMEDLKQRLKANLSFIKTLIVVCPLVGLLGTVTGMIEVFDVMGMIGTSDVKSMANGVSMATIPTMAGMVVALSGILFEKRVEHTIKYQSEKFYLELSKVL